MKQEDPTELVHLPPMTNPFEKKVMGSCDIELSHESTKVAPEPLKLNQEKEGGEKSPDRPDSALQLSSENSISSDGDDEDPSKKVKVQPETLRKRSPRSSLQCSGEWESSQKLNSEVELCPARTNQLSSFAKQGKLGSKHSLETNTKRSMRTRYSDTNVNGATSRASSNSRCQKRIDMLENVLTSEVEEVPKAVLDNNRMCSFDLCSNQSQFTCNAFIESTPLICQIGSDSFAGCGERACQEHVSKLPMEELPEQVSSQYSFLRNSLDHLRGGGDPEARGSSESGRSSELEAELESMIQELKIYVCQGCQSNYDQFIARRKRRGSFLVIFFAALLLGAAVASIILLVPSVPETARRSGSSN